MKKLTILSLALLTLGTVAFAQQQRPATKEDRAVKMNRQSDNMTEQLGLNPAQQEQVKNIREKYRAQMQALRTNTALSQVERRTQMKSIADKQHSEISAILTPEQRTKMEAMRSQRMNGMEKSKGEWKDGKGNKGEWKNKDGKTKAEWKDSKGNRGKMNKRNKGAMAMQELNLTDAQKTSLQAMRTETQTKTKAIRANTSLTDEQKKTQIRALHSEMKNKQRAILTPDQQKKWDEKLARGRSMKNA